MNILIAISCTFLAIAGWIMYRTYCEADKIRDKTERYKRKLIWKKNNAIFLGLVSIGNLFDTGSPIPIPLVGLPSVLFSVGLAIGSFWMYSQYRAPKDVEALELASELPIPGYLTLIVLRTKMGLTHKQAIMTLNSLVENDEVVILNPEEKRVSERIYLVRGYSGRPRAAAQAGNGQPPGNGQAEESFWNQGQADADGQTQAGHTDDDIRFQHWEVASSTADEVSRMILEGTFEVGQNGQPIPRRR